MLQITIFFQAVSLHESVTIAFVSDICPAEISGNSISRGSLWIIFS